MNKVFFKYLTRKTNLMVILMALICGASLSCGPDDPESASDPVLNVTGVPNIELSSEGTAVTAGITVSVENTDWNVMSNEGWLHANKNGQTVMVSADKNQNTDERKGTIIISATKDSKQTYTLYVTQKGVTAQIAVSPTSASLLCDKGSTTNLTVTATGSWNLLNLPDWIHASATSGVGNTTIVLTALSENWSDESRSTVLTISSDNLSTSCTVSQLPSLPSGLRVECYNETLMSDGFAYDLKFGPNAKGYKEAFYTESRYLTMTDRDIYNELMKNTEYNKLADYAVLPGVVDPGTTLIYCVASYGNDNNPDGTHKYGPITIVRITTKQQTLQDDMYMTSSYTSSQWKVTTSRTGQYGQKCDEYYYYAAEGDFAETLATYYQYFTYAYIAHMYFKPMIAKNSNDGYKYGPQTMNFNRNKDKFFCVTWGIDRETKQFSADLSNAVYRDLSSSSSRAKVRQKMTQSDLNKPFIHPSRAEIAQLRNVIRVYKAE